MNADPDCESQSHRDHLRGALLSSSNQFDSAVLKLSSGLLAVSAAFLRGPAQGGAPHAKWLLVVSWALLGTAILSTVVSFLASQSTIRAQLEDNDSSAALWSVRTTCLNAVSAVMFILGVALTIMFVSLNA